MMTSPPKTALTADLATGGIERKWQAKSESGLNHLMLRGRMKTRISVQDGYALLKAMILPT